MSGRPARRALTPIDILRNCRGKPVSVELVSGETFNGIVMRTDRAMNVVMKQCIRTGRTGDTFWRARETLLRGASIRNVRMDEVALKAPPPPPAGGPRRGPREDGGTGSGGAAASRKRERDGAADSARPMLSKGKPKG